MMTAAQAAPIPRPGRPLGVTLALAASVLLFSCLPTLQVAMIVIVQLRLRSQLPAAPGTDAPLGGVDLRGITDAAVLAQLALGLLVFAAAVIAWRGRRRWIRVGFSLLITALTVLTVVTGLASALTPTDLRTTGLDSGADLTRTLALGRVGLTLLIGLYVVWYLNRAPARAFFRGSYLPDSKTGAD